MQQNWLLGTFITAWPILNVFNCSGIRTQANGMIINNELTEYSIVRVNRHLCNNMQGKKVIVILELDILKPGEEVLQYEQAVKLTLD